MSLEKVTKPYELLIRFREDGKIGAHTQDNTVITDDGVVVSSKTEDPKAISLEELQALVAGYKQEDWYVPPVIEETPVE